MITSFKDEFSFLSNFYPIQVVFEGMSFNSVEYAYQAAKTLDLNVRRAIAMLPTPGQAKRHGQIIGLRNDWSNIRLGVMEFLLRQKFSVNSFLSPILVDTYPEILIEGNNWKDEFWGACLKNGVWIGENHLGKLLMKIRQEHLWR